MKKLMKAAALAICAGAMMCIAGCGADSPRDLALAEAKKMAAELGEKNAKFTVKSEDVGDTEAKIVLDGDGSKMTFKFHKEDGKWKCKSVK